MTQIEANDHSAEKSSNKSSEIAVFGRPIEIMPPNALIKALLDDNTPEAFRPSLQEAYLSKDVSSGMMESHLLAVARKNASRQLIRAAEGHRQIAMGLAQQLNFNIDFSTSGTDLPLRPDLSSLIVSPDNTARFLRGMRSLTEAVFPQPVIMKRIDQGDLRRPGERHFYHDLLEQVRHAKEVVELGLFGVYGMESTEVQPALPAEPGGFGRRGRPAQEAVVRWEYPPDVTETKVILNETMRQMFQTEAFRRYAQIFIGSSDMLFRLLKGLDGLQKDLGQMGNQENQIIEYLETVTEEALSDIHTVNESAENAQNAVGRLQQTSIEESSRTLALVPEEANEFTANYRVANDAVMKLYEDSLRQLERTVMILSLMKSQPERMAAQQETFEAAVELAGLLPYVYTEWIASARNLAIYPVKVSRMFLALQIALQHEERMKEAAPFILSGQYPDLGANGLLEALARAMQDKAPLPKDLPSGK